MSTLSTCTSISFVKLDLSDLQSYILDDLSKLVSNFFYILSNYVNIESFDEKDDILSIISLICNSTSSLNCIASYKYIIKNCLRLDF